MVKYKQIKFTYSKNRMAETAQFKYPTVKDMYGMDDLGNDPIFPGNFINYGFWEGIYRPGLDISREERILSQANLYKAVFQRLNIQSDERVLEVGCGRGAGLALAGNIYPPTSLYGVDFSPFQAVRSQKNTAGEHQNLHILSAKAEELPFDDSSFDRIYSIEALQHFTSVPDFITQISRIIKPKGKAVLSTFLATNQQAIPSLNDMFPTMKRGVDNAVPVGNIQMWFELSGFADIKTESIGNEVWEPFVKWCEQVKPEEVSSNWLEAYKSGLLDYYIISATKGNPKQRVAHL